MPMEEGKGPKFCFRCRMFPFSTDTGTGILGAPDHWDCKLFPQNRGSDMPRFLLIRLSLYNIINTNLKFEGITIVGAVFKINYNFHCIRVIMSASVLCSLE